MENAKATSKTNWTVLMCLACLIIGGYFGALWGIGHASDSKDREWQLQLNTAVYDARNEAINDVEAEYAVNWHNIRLAYKLVRLFVDEDSRPRHYSSQRDSEIAALHVYMAFGELSKQWEWLTPHERQIFLNTAPVLPTDIYESDGTAFASIGGIQVMPKDPVAAFEEFLRYSYMETDSMEGWSIFDGSTFGQPQRDYEKWLKAKGLHVPDPPEKHEIESDDD